MSYGANLLINPSAETQDTSDWTVNGVTVEENTTVETTYSHIINDADGWLGQYDHKITLVGAAGDYCFVFASDVDSSMTQILYASDIGATPDSFQFIVSFKLANQQNAWDASVLGRAILEIYYDDGLFDYFTIPLVTGLYHVDRNLVNFWVKTVLVCTMDNTKTIEQITVSIETDNFTQSLNVDYIELRKEV